MIFSQTRALGLGEVFRTMALPGRRSGKSESSTALVEITAELHHSRPAQHHQITVPIGNVESALMVIHRTNQRQVQLQRIRHMGSVSNTKLTLMSARNRDDPVSATIDHPYHVVVCIPDKYIALFVGLGGELPFAAYCTNDCFAD